MRPFASVVTTVEEIMRSWARVTETTRSGWTDHERIRFDAEIGDRLAHEIRVLRVTLDDADHEYAAVFHMLEQ